MARTVPLPRLAIDAAPLATRLQRTIEDTVRRFGLDGVVLGVSGGVDSAVVSALAARALGPERVLALLLPYRDLGAASLARAERWIAHLGLRSERVDITPMVDAYEATQPDMTWHRRGNVQARARMIVQFDKLTQHGLLPIGTGNRSESLLGYFTEHGDDAPKLEPLADLYKTQVWQLAEHLAVPDEIVEAVPSAGLEPDQTDEGDFGVSYAEIDLILALLEAGFDDEAVLAEGVSPEALEAVRERVVATRRKRLPTIAPAVQPTSHDPTAFMRRAPSPPRRPTGSRSRT